MARAIRQCTRRGFALRVIVKALCGRGRADDSIGIATLDEDRLTALGVTFTLGPPGKGGISWDDQGKMISGEDGVAAETLRFAESLEWSSPGEPRRWKPARPQARVHRRPGG